MDDQEISIYFGGELANLYELGWISTDMSQLIAFSELVETGNIERAEKYFGEKSRPFNRYVSITEKREKRPEIVEVKKGSVELIIAGATLAAAVIMPLVQIAVQRHYAAKSEAVTFQLSAQDQGLRRVIDAYECGDLGQGRDGLEMLMSVLQQRNYDVSVLANNIYLIEHVVERYSQRIIKTINMNM